MVLYEITYLDPSVVVNCDIKILWVLLSILMFIYRQIIILSKYNISINLWFVFFLILWNNTWYTFFWSSVYIYSLYMKWCELVYVPLVTKSYNTLISRPRYDSFLWLHVHHSIVLKHKRFTLGVTQFHHGGQYTHLLHDHSDIDPHHLTSSSLIQLPSTLL